MKSMPTPTKTTPMMRQYSEIKKSLPKNTLLFFRLGDFYELFNEDAEIGSKILGITLTKRGTMPMAGIPYHAATTYINKILQRGYKIAICDQVESPRPGKLVKRSLSRILSPGTAISEQQIDAKHNRYILALTTTKSDISMAWAEASTGEFQIATSKNPQDLLPIAYALNPSEIILPENYQRDWKKLHTNTLESIDSLLQNRTLSELPDFYFDAIHGANIAKEILGVMNFDGYGISPQYYPALGPAGALLHYLKENFCQTPQNVRCIRLYNPKQILQVDNASIKNLEIFYSVSGQRVGSLIHAIDKTITAAGARQLEKFLIEPSLNRDEIIFRQKCVRGFYDDVDLCKHVQNCLNTTYDLARILTRLQQRMKNPRDLNAVKLTIKQLPGIKQFLSTSGITELGRLSDEIFTFSELDEVLSSALMESNLPSDLSMGGYIKPGYDSQLDDYRSLSTNCRAWINEFEKKEQQATGIKSLKIKYSGTFGYFIEVTKSNVSSVPSHYIRRQTTVNAERYTTVELKTKEAEIENAQALSIALEEKIFNSLVAKTLESFDTLHSSACVLSQLDVFCGWGQLAREWKYCCPEISNDDCLEIVDGRHPVIEQILHREAIINPANTTQFIPNGLDLRGDATQIAIITGPNMAGKSTYIRQVALLALLAHTGCWVPAKRCRLSMIDKIFSRIGSGDDLSHGRSTFMMEMSETANILNNMSNISLVILDEIGRGTSTYDGLSLAWAVIEYLHRDGVRGPKTLFATHYHELTKLGESLPRVKNFQMEVKEWKDGIIFMRRVISGAADKSYGIHVARLAGIPMEVIVRANEVMKELEEEGKIFVKNIWSKRRPSGPADDQITFL